MARSRPKYVPENTRRYRPGRHVRSRRKSACRIPFDRWKGKMSSVAGETAIEANLGTGTAGRSHPLRTVENLALALALAGLVVLPLVEIVLRKFVHTGISGASSFVENLTLVAGMLGA